MRPLPILNGVKHTTLFCKIPHFELKLLKGSHFNLSNALATDTVMLAQFFKRHHVVR